MFLINLLGRLWYGKRRWDEVNAPKTPVVYRSRAAMTPLERVDFERLTSETTNDRHIKPLF